MEAWTTRMQIDHYVLQAPIGARGAGEVWKAHDTELDCVVAMRRLNGSLCPQFEQKARALATLDHPHICILYDVDPNYLVMEFVEGDKLSTLLERGALPLDDAIRYAIQIAAGLGAAHAKGLVHGRLQPRNILINKDGVKLMNFSLAKLGQPGSVDQLGSMPAPGNSGQILSTLRYISPEQMNGAEPGPLSDIFSFGLIFYQMLTGEAAIEGSTPASAAVGILKRSAPSILAVSTPAFQQVLSRCLEKNSENRWQNARDLEAALQVASAAHQAPAVVQRSSVLGKLLATSAAVLAVAALALGLHFRDQIPLGTPIRFRLALADTLTNNGFSISPDGRMLAFFGTGKDEVTRLWLRSLDSTDSVPIKGSEWETRDGVPPPFWSPDSRFVAFQSPSGLRKLDVSSGESQAIADVKAPVLGGSWNRDNLIIFSTNSGPLMRVSAAGGPPVPLTRFDESRQEIAHVFPTFLPDGRHFFYLRLASKIENSGIYIGSVDSKPEHQDLTMVVPTQFAAAYVPFAGTGQLLFRRGDTLMTQPLDQRTMMLTGRAVPVAEHLGSYLSDGFFSASGNGVLVYKTGAVGQDLQLTRLDPHGAIVRNFWEPGYYSGVALSPDGTRAAVERFDYQSANGDLWLVNFAANTGIRLTYHPSRDLSPVWSSDGTRIAFASDRDGVYNLYQKNSNGAAEEFLVRSLENKMPTSWSPDGRYLLYTVVDPKTNNDIWVLRLDGRKLIPFLRTGYDEYGAQFSPDERWVAYVSNESGQSEVYVRPFSLTNPGASEKWLISKGGGTNPKWLAHGVLLSYLRADRHLIAVDVAGGGPRFAVGSQRDLFALPAGVYAFDVEQDGHVFAAVPTHQDSTTQLTVVLNWQAGLRN